MRGMLTGFPSSTLEVQMIKITNGSEVYEVTSGAFESIYKSMGFYPFSEAAEHAEAEQVVEEPVEPELEAEQEAETADPDEAFCEELAKKPIGQWNKAEVKRYASVKGIDISGTKSINEARDRIKAAQEDW